MTDMLLSHSRHRAAQADPDSIWWERAACKEMDVELFFPDQPQHDQATIAKAKKICAACPVRQQCLNFAMSTMSLRTDYGIYGGTTPWERRRLSRSAHTPANQRLTDCDQAVAAFKRASQVGIGQTAGELGVNSRSLYRAWDRWQLGRPVSPYHVEPFSRDEAVAAFRLAGQLGLTAAAQKLERSPASLYRAWDQYDLGRPDLSASVARRQQHSGSSDRGRTFRRLEQTRRAGGRISKAGTQEPADERSGRIPMAVDRERLRALVQQAAFEQRPHDTAA